MSDLTDPTPNAAHLTAELKALHARRERAPLSPTEEARYAELWAWWQASAEFAAAPSAGVAPSVPEEWLAAFDDDAANAGAPGERVSTPGEPATGGIEQDLLSEWEAWQAKQSSGDPFDLIADELGGASGSAYEDVMSARAEVLGSEAPVGELAEDPELVRDADADAGAGSGAGAGAGAGAEAAHGDAERGSESAPEIAPATPAAPASAVPLQGARRVVIHLSDGQARRGQVADVELSGDTFDYIAAGGAIESVPRSEVRTVFFMRVAGAPARSGDGTPIRVVLRDGRELVGRSPDHASDGDGFTLIPDETLTSAALVWISRSAVRSVTARG